MVPDTSPRGLGVEGEDDQMHIGTAAGFYLDATQPKWSKYRMCAACRCFRSLLHVFFGSCVRWRHPSVLAGRLLSV